MEEYAEKIQIILNTLQTINIPATFHNMNRLMGVYKELATIRDYLNGKEEPGNGEVNAE